MVRSPPGTVVGEISATLEPRCHEAPPPQSTTAGSGQRAARGSVYFQIDVEEPETSENLTQSVVIHHIVWRHTWLFAVIINII